MKNLILFISLFSSTLFAQNNSILWEAKKDTVNIYIMVGIGHLDYSNGLIMLFKNKGFTVQPISFIIGK